MSKGSYPVHDKRGNLVGREVYVEGKGWVYRPMPKPVEWIELDA